MCLHPQARGTAGYPGLCIPQQHSAIQRRDFPTRPSDTWLGKNNRCPSPAGNFPAVVADPSGGARPQPEGWRNIRLQGDEPDRVTGGGGGNAIRNARTRLATTSTSSVSAKGEPTQMRGPAPNGM